MRRAIQTWWQQPSGGREVLAVALPLVVSTSSWTLMQFIDRVYLAWYSADAVAAALPAGVLYFWLVCFFLGLASYANTFVAQYYGAGRERRIGLAVWQGVWVGLVSIPLMLLTIPLAPAIFRYMDHAPQVQALEVVYYQIIAVGGGATVLSSALSAFFSGRSQVRTVMLVDALAAVVNIALDYAWIFGRWGFPEWGVVGAAWATVVALWFKVFLLLALMLRRDVRHRFGVVAGCRFDAPLMRRLLRFGSPSGLQFFLEMSGFSLFVVLVGRLGVLELTASNLAFNVNSLAFLPVYGFGWAVTTLVGQRLGENRPDLAARATWSTCAVAGGYSLLMSLLYLLVPDLFMLGYQAHANPETYPAIHALTVLLLRYVAIYCLLDAINIIFVSALKGAGDTRFVMLATVLTSAGASLAIWSGYWWLGGGLHWAWSGLTGWICLLGVIYVARFLQGSWRTMRVIEPELSAVEDEPVLAEFAPAAAPPAAAPPAAAPPAAAEPAAAAPPS